MEMRERLGSSALLWGAGARRGFAFLLALLALALRRAAGYPRCQNDELNWSAIARQIDQGVDWPVSGPAFVHTLRAVALQTQATYPQALEWMGVAGVFVAVQVLLWGYRRMGLRTSASTWAALALTSYFWAPLLEARPQQWGQLLVFAGALSCWLWLRGQGGWACFALLAMAAFTHILSHFILLYICAFLVLASRVEGRPGSRRSAAVLAALVASLGPYAWPGGPYQRMLVDLRDNHLPQLLALAPYWVAASLSAGAILTMLWRRRYPGPARLRTAARQLRRHGRAAALGLMSGVCVALAVQAWLLPPAAWQPYGGSVWRFALFQGGNVLFMALFIAGSVQLLRDAQRRAQAPPAWSFLAQALAAIASMAVAALAGSFWALDTNWFLRLVNYGVLFAAPVAGVGLVRALQWLRPAWAAWTGVGLATIVSVLSVVRPPALLGC